MRSVVEKIFLIRFVGVLSFLVFLLLEFYLVFFVFSFLLFYLDGGFFIPSFWSSLAVSFGVFVLVLFFSIKFFRVFVPSLGALESLIFGKRRFVLEAIIQLENSSKKPEEYIRDFEEIDKEIKKLVVGYVRNFVVLSAFFVVFLVFSYFGFRSIFEDFYKFLAKDFGIKFNSFVSSDVPLTVEVLPNFRVDSVFVVVGSNVSELKEGEGKFFGEVAFSEVVDSDRLIMFDVLTRKYGLVWRITNLSVNFVGTFKLLSNRVRVFYDGFEVSSYDYVPDLSVVKRSEVVFDFVFSYEVSKVNVKGYGLRVSKEVDRNVAKVSVYPLFSTVVSFSFSDGFGRTFEFGPVSVSIRTNDTPSVRIKYPEKDMMITMPSFLLNGFGEVVDNDSIVSAYEYSLISNTLTHYVRKTKSLDFQFDGSSFLFSIDSKKEGLIPGDRVVINILAKDIYGAVGVGSRIIYLPTFSELARMLENKLGELSKQVYSAKGDVFELKNVINDKGDLDFSETKVLDKVEKVLNVVSNIASSGSELEEVLETLDRYKALSEDVKKLKSIRERLQKIVEDKEFSEIASKLFNRKGLEYERIGKKIDDLGKVLAELDIEVKRISEFKDIIKAISKFGDIENNILRNMEAENGKLNDDIGKQLKEFVNDEDFKKLKEGLKSSLMDKIKALKQSSSKKDLQSVKSMINDMNFELFKELMRSMFELQSKQKTELWDRYLEILRSQVLLTKAKNSLDTLKYVHPRIDKVSMSNEISLINEAFKVYRLNVNMLIESIYLDTSLSEDIFEIENILRKVENNFYTFNSAVFSGSTYELIEVLASSIDLTSMTLKKILDLGDKMREGINLLPSGVSMGELMEMYRQISEMLRDIMEGKGDGGMLRELEKLVRKAIERAKSLESSRPGDGNAKEIRKELEKILDEIVKGNYSSAYDITQRLDFNTLEYQRGMFEKGISEKREAERPKAFKYKEVDNVVGGIKLEKLKSQYFKAKYMEVINNYRRAIFGD